MAKDIEELPLEIQGNSEIWEKKIKKLLSEKHMSQRQLSEKSHVSTGAISGWFAKEKDGKAVDGKKPRIDNLIDIANTLEVPIEYLVGETENRDITNFQIGMRLGLLDGAISKLEELHCSDKRGMFTMNYLISNSQLFERIKEYLMCIVIKHVEQTNWNLITLERQSAANYEDICFAAILNALPSFALQMSGSLNEDSELLDALACEYIAENADKEKLSKAMEFFSTEDEGDIEFELEQRAIEEFNQLKSDAVAKSEYDSSNPEYTTSLFDQAKQIAQHRLDAYKNFTHYIAEKERRESASYKRDKIENISVEELCSILGCDSQQLSSIFRRLFVGKKVENLTFEDLHRIFDCTPTQLDNLMLKKLYKIKKTDIET